MTQDPVVCKEDDARETESLLLQNGAVKFTETNKGTSGMETQDTNQNSPEIQKQGNEELDDNAEEADITNNEPLSTEFDEGQTRCGFGSCQPSWLQWFASKKSYVVVFGSLGMLQIALAAYFVATISTLEKRFKIPSRTTGLISSGWDIGGVSSSLVLSYHGSRGHKTRWVAAGSFLVAISCFILYAPHMIYGPGQDALELTEEYGTHFVPPGNSSEQSLGDSSGISLCNGEHPHENLEDCSIGSTSTLPAVILFFAHIVLGIGGSMYYTLGIAYMDDNVRKNKTPFLLAVWQCIRMLGPTFGYLLGSYALHLYVDPSLHPTITDDDPRWIGAWWLGWIPLGIVMFFLSFNMALFPKKLPRAARRSQMNRQPPPSTTKSFSDFKNVLKRLVRNKVLLFNSFSSVCFMFGYIGYWTFMPKYMETQFRQSASSSSLITGSIGLIFSALGILASGIVISVFKPHPRYLAGWNVIVEILDVMGHFSYSFLNCAVDDLHGSPGSDNSWDLSATCNSNCNCGPMVKYSPVCSSEGNTTFYSPCHAGCTTMDFVNGTKIFGNCSCIGDGAGWTKDGACPVDCTSSFTIFLIVQCTMRFFSASGRAGNTIIQFRCVEQDDKAMSIGFTEALLGILAFIPGPIVYGMLLDSACMVWGQTCGHTGNCWLYDGQRLGFLLNFTASGFLLGGTLLDIGVWYHVKDLKIYDEKDPEKEKKKSRNNTNKS